MQKKTIVFLLCALIFASPIQAHATETQDTTEKTAAGVAEDVKTGAEAETVRSPVRQDALTEEQAEEGWKIIGGYAYPPEALAGDAGISAGGTGSFSNENSLTNVTFDLKLPPGQTEPFVLYFTNADTYQEYYVVLYASNDYQDTFKMPVGAYYFTGGGPENDYMSLFEVVSPDAFVVEPDEDLYLQPVVVSRASGLTAGTEESQSSAGDTQKTEEKTSIQEIKEKNKPWQVYAALAGALLAVAGLISVVALKLGKYKERR